MSIILFIVILAILILVHEFGHFIVAKKSGIRVDEFGLGFPPKIFSKKYGGTEYSINAIPFGGFVKIYGEDSHFDGEEIKDKNKSFFYKPKWIQAMVLVAGVTFNLIFAWLLISLGFMVGQEVSVGLSSFGEVQNQKLVITSVMSNSPAEKAGLKAGDNIIFAEVSGKAVDSLTAENISKVISESSEGDVTLMYKRGEDNPQTAFISPSSDIVQGKRIIGISMDTMGILKLSPHLALMEGIHTTYLLTISTAKGLTNFIWQSITFRSDFSQVSGPIGIASIVGEASRLGFMYLISFIAVISINLALINLIPFPALDGGRLLFVAIEAIIRRPISPKITQTVNAIGFILLIILMIVISGHDIMNLL